SGEALAAALKWHWQERRAVTLRFSSELQCAFVKDQTRVTEGPERVTELSVNALSVASSSTKVRTTHQERVWKLHLSYRLSIYPGNDASAGLVLDSFSGDAETVSPAETTPFPETTINPSHEVAIGALLQSLSPETLSACFRIRRDKASCKTPRRNPDVEEALSFFLSLSQWYQQLDNYLSRDFFAKHRISTAAPSFSLPNDFPTFVPVLPLLDAAAPEAAQVLLSPEDCAQLLAEQSRSITAEVAQLATAMPPEGGPGLASARQAKIYLLTRHGLRVGQALALFIQFIETMLLNQLIKAIGREVSPNDFSQLIRFHRQRLFRPQFLPRLFSYALRRPGRFPEGTVAIEESTPDGMPGPIFTSVRCVPEPHLMGCPISESVTLSFRGERFIHSWLEQEFAGSSAGVSYHIKARARAFSCFVMVLGRISSATVFSPTTAIILQNKDELRVPLSFERLPTPKQFKDAISSLSPEMQRFSKAYRSMQLESTLFGLLVIEIKPQLEKLLKLPPGSLSKQVQLTQDLLTLFIEYQIPSDLLSYDGPEDAAVELKIARVTQLVAAVNDMVAQQQAEELAKAEEERRFRQAELLRLQAERLAREQAERAERERALENVRMRREISMNESAMEMRAPARKVGGFFSSLINTFGGGAMARSGMVRMDDACFSAPPCEPALEYRSAPCDFDDAGATPEVCASPITSPSSSSTAVSKSEAPKATPLKDDTPAEAPKVGGLKESVETPAKTPSTELPVVQHIDVEDYSKIPSELDQKYDQLDEDSAVRAAIINLGSDWELQSQTILSERTTKTLTDDLQREQRNRAYDLLDALSRSGSLDIDAASLHIVLAASHSFDKSLINTVVQDNINPVAKLERSSLIAAATIQKAPVLSLVTEEHVDRISQTLPALIKAFP
ncbi:MAG: hypothetical protein Q8P67_04000, partial [archaeon]|nr:hypothetical protein [archaeon]